MTPRPRPARLELAGVRATAIDNDAFEPALARRVDVPPSGAWVHEPKLDGYRLLAAVAGGKVRLWSRNGVEWTERVPQIGSSVGSLGATSLRLDGELVALAPKKGSSRGSDFNALQSALSGTGDAELRYVVFDVLHVDGNHLVDVALEDRKRVLAALLARPHDLLVQEGAWAVGDGAALYARAVADGHEGLVSKRAGSTYRGGRGGDWVKVRTRDAEELAVVGYTEPRGSRSGIGALLMGRPLVGGGWGYAGRVGTGMDTALLDRLGDLLPKLARVRPTVVEASLAVPRAAGDLRGVHWVTPKLTVEVEHHGTGNGGLLRQPSVKTLRLDKRASDLRPAGDRAVEVSATAARPRRRRSPAR